jgi:hypothetical protein
VESAGHDEPDFTGGLFYAQLPLVLLGSATYGIKKPDE